ncbi:ATPase [Acaricomes phytoseiuli]|uniref:N-acetylglucosamine kinase n=1 Tax=Acaricomes phytoseiuli TaxID=291968 RepID=UPI00037C5E15|nr:BadF/BadG/BcrA/BcrD ATPase family protein [Acaricomes phytoseiuli]MCW1250165.1 ATPase [Acaricomes phytoseiuli]
MESTAKFAEAIIGLDIGGSKVRGILWRDGEVIADEQAGSANVQNVSEQQARESLAELFRKLPQGRLDQVFAGSGGIDTEADAEALAALIRPNVSGTTVTVVHDTRLLLAAGRAQTGVAVIAGTGSATWGISSSGQQARAGGWGYLLGDEGSGYWLGREAVRHSLRRMDLGQGLDLLAETLLQSCGLSRPDELIAHFHSGTSRRYWAAKSPLVFDAAANGHQASLEMIRTAGRDLADMAAQVAEQIASSGPFVLGSGVGMHQPLLQEVFRSELAGRGYTDVRVLDRDPIFGALELARQHMLRGPKSAG